MERHGWTLKFHDCIISQLTILRAAAEKAEQRDPNGAASDANVKLFNAVVRQVLEVVPLNPGADIHRQGNTLGTDYRHWRRAKFSRRFRLFFRYDSTSKIIVYAWVNDESTLRKAGASSDPYEVFGSMLRNGVPPDNWAALSAASKDTF